MSATTPIKCTPCRVTINGNRYCIYEDGSVSSALTYDEIQRMGFVSMKEVFSYESDTMTRLDPHSTEAKTIRCEASRLRHNRNARDRYQANRNLGMKQTPYGWE
jgi:hypothetical protein